MARVLVTGGAGFVGSHLTDALLARGDEVVVVDDLSTGRRSNLDHVDEHACTLIAADLCDGIDLDGRVDAVLHLASPASPKDYLARPVETLRVGSVGTHVALSVALEHGARFLLASTSEVYGDPLEHPQAEHYWGNVNPIGPRSCYDEAKRYAEAAVMAHHRTFGLDVAIVRIFNTYGPRMAVDDGRVVSNFLTQALSGKPITIYGDGTQTRSFCYVSDQIAGILALLDSGITGPVNIGNPDEFTMMQLAELVLELTGSDSEVVFEPLPQDDPRQRRPDISLATEALGWEPRIDLRTGLGLAIPYFQDELGL